VSLLLRLLTPSGVSGTIAATNANDIAAFAGSPVIAGSMAVTNANDTADFSGTASTSIPVSAGDWTGGRSKRRAISRADEERLQREALGIIPPEIQAVIQKVSEKQATQTELAQKLQSKAELEQALTTNLKKYSLEYQEKYYLALHISYLMAVQDIAAAQQMEYLQQIAALEVEKVVRRRKLALALLLFAT